MLIKNLTKLGARILAVASFVCSAHALTITPGLAIQWGDETANQHADDISARTGTPNLEELYKQNAGDPFPADSGFFAGSYVTTYNGDLSGGTVDYISGSSITGSPLYLYVKDGNNNPAWYLFNISAWNGTDNLDLSEFWTDKGSISHIAIYGTNTTGNTPGVPDGGTTAALLGGSFVLLALARRKLVR